MEQPATGNTEHKPGNPFSRQGVADFGVRHKTCVFEFMLPILDAAHDYLRSETRIGGDEASPLAISGIHGSGKTHLLNWLADEIAGVESARAMCLYAKADSDSFADLYRELLKNISRRDIIILINEAVDRLAEAKMLSARISEDLGPDVRNAQSLDAFVESGYLDTNELERTLLTELAKIDSESISSIEGDSDSSSANDSQTLTESEKEPKNEDHSARKSLSGFASTLARMIVMVDDEENGEAAFTWLRGGSVGEQERLGVASSLFELAATGQRSSADAVAIDALESVAALFRIAERPLVVMVDQAEVFSRSATDDPRRETIFSLVKKFVEQLKRQGALVVISGAPDAWEGIRRDIWPRLSAREPISVGFLTLEETQLMLETYTGTTEALSPDILKLLHTISGGTPREIVRIGHQAFAKVQSSWQGLTEDLLKASAVNAGTIRERELFALEVIDKILVDYDPAGESGRGIQRDLALDASVEIKRILRTSSGQTLAFTILSSTDPLTETDAASQVVSIARRVHQDFASAVHFVIAIGYSSEEVKENLKSTSVVIGFDEKSFESDLRLELFRRIDSDPLPATADHSEKITEALASLETKLNELSQERRIAESSAMNEVAEKLEEQAAPQIKAREVRTRWELIDLLEKLEERLRVSGEYEPAEERRMVRSLLVANELNIRSNVVDYGGGLYLDLIDAQLRARNPDSEREFYHMRSEVLSILRRLVRPRGSVMAFLERPPVFAMMSLVAVLMGIAVLGITLSYSGFYLTEQLQKELVLNDLGITLVIASIVAVIGVPVCSYWFSNRRASAPFRGVYLHLQHFQGGEED